MDITGPKEILIISREAHQFGKTGKIIFLFWNDEQKVRDYAICYRTEESKEFKTFYTGEAGKNQACGTDGYVFIKDKELFFVAEEDVPSFENDGEATHYFERKSEEEGLEGLLLRFGQNLGAKKFLKTGDKVKIWLDTPSGGSPDPDNIVKQLNIMDFSL
ncbi:DUF3221 domain-containing protein [Neobacillus notoginsengisoli]|uniref:DUF3221 domain-containing protein n=1 Tax=Neobacillus notoginsengisoli TaxID=1578198 RepID=A0A417YR94_9BACI|nr:DUF3221 domain-containing protein [Neobacillus notoginsengisoli]RHW37374.1 DUF3221 domain-containing protein [Neobacillus notoginsengisoli]